MPLFPGYLFLLGEPSSSLEAYQTRQVAKCLKVDDQARLHNDLVRVHQLVTCGSLLTPEKGLQPGTPVEIIDGPLAGLQGKILRQGKKLKFVVEVHFIQRGASVEIDASMIRRLNGVG
jgi:transcriptional antiterminator RfaH